MSDSVLGGYLLCARWIWSSGFCWYFHDLRGAPSTFDVRGLSALTSVASPQTENGGYAAAVDASKEIRRGRTRPFNQGSRKLLLRAAEGGNLQGFAVLVEMQRDIGSGRIRDTAPS